MSYHIYEVVEGPAYPEPRKKQRMLAWTSARGHLRRAAFDVNDVICVYGAEVSEVVLESVVEKKTAGLKTPWLRFTFDEFAERLKKFKRDLTRYYDEAHAPMEAHAPTRDVTMAPMEVHAQMDVVMAAVEAPAEKSPTKYL